ncbi:hypothetical protein DWB85_14095 [Seongchinamella sediminis]|uniref:SbsA Ig-like domain-containing protein n=1 Tax=Seongchinamella sediminis TaxID=2283635 RepID=A0A3L7DUE9_9GAMM|nr:hypothetical protein [Seongchinamella sediminis]RLQ21207.1 hypothetical protein DWB85_14095 [Seongchinamella sediminis]
MRTCNRQSVKVLGASLLIAVLSACGGGGGGGGGSSSPDPAPPAPAPEPQSAQITDARGLSPHYIEVSFADDVAVDELDPAEFSIVAANGDELEVMELLPADDTRTGRLVVSPGLLQPLEEYDLKHKSLTGEPLRIIGEPAVEPRLESVVTLSQTELLLTFDNEMSQQSVQNQSAYLVIPYLDGEPEPGAQPLPVQSVELLADQRRLILTTAPQDNREYRVEIRNISNVNNTYINPEYAQGGFVGIGEDDTSPPGIIDATIEDSNQLSISFSEPVCRTGGNPGNYAVEYCLPAMGTASCAPGADSFQAFVNQVELDEFCTAATLTTSFIPPGAVISVDVNNVIDNTGNVLDGGTVIRPETPEEVASARPRLSSVISLSSSEVLATFDTRLDATSAEDRRFYRIIAADNGRPRIEEGELTVSSASLQSDAKTVLLRTSGQEVREYLLLASNIANEPGQAVIDPEYSSAVFYGRGSVESDTTRPSITGVSRGGAGLVYAEFSEPLCTTAGDETLYRLSYCLPEEGAATCNDYASVALAEAQLNEYCTRVALSNEDIPSNALLRLQVTGLTDAAGNLILNNGSSFSIPAFSSPGDNTGTMPPPPVVVGAISTSNTSIKVVFSQAMDDAAEVAANYVVAQSNVNGEAGSLAITGAAFSGPERSEIVLTTLSQNDVTYQLTVIGVRDSFGQPFQVQATNVGFVTANTAQFAGTPPNGGTVIDTDGDGLADNEEQRGWVTRVQDSNGQFQEREVTSDPFTADTDGDGLSDGVERQLGTDPRNRDTDSDGIGDAHEYNGIFSQPTRQDSDGDGLSDGEELNFYKTSPLLKDTDGDQISDEDEVILANRNARIADLPQPTFEIESIGLELDVRFDETSSSGTTTGETETVAATLTQSESQTRSRTSEVNDQISASVTAKAQYELGGDATVGKLTAGIEVSAGYEHSWSSSWSEESARASQEEYNKSLESAREVSEETSINRVVEDARISTLLYLSAAGDVAFTVRNLQITALVDDIRNPGRYLPVATLKPAENTPNEFNLGPLVGDIGPLIFSASGQDVFPGQVERLMQDPSGVIFRLSNYDIEDENGRNFAFTSQNITDRTTSFSLDFGGLPATEYYRVATSFGRRIGTVADSIAASEGLTTDEVRLAYGLALDDDDSFVAFDLAGKNLGVVFHDVMQDVLGLTRYDTNTDTTSPAAQASSYATSFGADGIERVTRIRQKVNSPNANWSLLSPSGLILSGQLSFGDGEVAPDDQVLFPGTGISLAFVEDQDRDSIPARLEALHGCDDSDLDGDTDNDGLDDYFEVFGAPRVPGNPEARINPGSEWLIGLAEAADYEGFASCSSADTDADGIDDFDEYSTANGYRTDAKKPDTDEDGLTDAEEINGFVAYLADADADIGSCSDHVFGAGESSAYPEFRAVFCTTDPLDRDSDNDGVWDGAELPYFANPTVDDFDDIGDLDGDGLRGFEETSGWEVTVLQLGDPRTCSGAGGQDCAAPPFNGVLPVSDPSNPDTDDDQVGDYQEFLAATHPQLADTDADGLSDDEELFGEVPDPLAGNGSNATIAIFTSALDNDTDGDGLLDGLELTPWTVRVGPTEDHYEVYSDPSDPNSDTDGLDDLAENIAGTDPNKANTDEDSWQWDDGEEVGLNIDPLDDSDMCVRSRVTDLYWEGPCTACDDVRADVRFGYKTGAASTVYTKAYFDDVIKRSVGRNADGYWGESVYMRISDITDLVLTVDDPEIWDNGWVISNTSRTTSIGVSTFDSATNTTSTYYTFKISGGNLPNTALISFTVEVMTPQDLQADPSACQDSAPAP